MIFIKNTRKTATMKIYTIPLLTILLSSCVTTGGKETKAPSFSFGNFSDRTTLSTKKIDNRKTFKKFYTLKGKTDCIEVSIKAAELQKTFPVGRTPVNIYFHVDKILVSDKVTHYIPITKNYNSQWTTFNPVRICGRESAPLSLLTPGDYRIRFTTLGKNSFYYKISIKSSSSIVFHD